MSFPHNFQMFMWVLQMFMWVFHIELTCFTHMFGGIVYGVWLFYMWNWWKLWSRVEGIQLWMFFFIYVIIISEFCRIGKWGNDGWIGGRKFGIKFGIVEFFHKVSTYEYCNIQAWVFHIISRYLCEFYRYLCEFST